MTQPLATPISRVCTVHKVHTPTPHEVQLHHVWPLGEGGPDVLENMVAVCPTGHTNIHILIRDLIHLVWDPALSNAPVGFGKGFARTEKVLAILGYQRLKRGAM